MYYKLEGDALDAHNKKVIALKTKLALREGLTPEQVITRDLRPEDIGMTSSEWKSSAIAKANTNAWNNIVNTVSIADCRFIVISGVNRGYGQGTTNAFSQLRITKAGRTARIWNIQSVEDLVGNTVYFTDPVDVAPRTQLTIEGYALTATTDKMIFIGTAIEKVGIELNP